MGGKVWWRKIIRSSLDMPNFPIGKIEDTREKAGKGGQWPALEMVQRRVENREHIKDI